MSSKRQLKQYAVITNPADGSTSEPMEIIGSEELAKLNLDRDARLRKRYFVIVTEKRQTKAVEVPQ